MSRRRTEVSVVMPALNEEKNIRLAVGGVFRAFHKLKINGELIVVDDGSSDRTPEILDRLVRQRAALRVIRHDRPGGIGGAFWAGVSRARGESVLMIPGDNENRPEDILRFLGLMGQVDIIVPFVHNAELRNRWRRFVSSLYRLIVSFSFGTTLNYYNGTVLYRTQLVRSLKTHSRGFFYQAEILIRSLRKGALFAEVPVLLENRNHGRSKAISFKNLGGVMADFLRLFWAIHFLRVESNQKKSAPR